MIRVLLVEDSAVAREYLAALLRDAGEFEVVGTARDGVEALEMVERLDPQVVLTDVHMPRMDGCEATRAIMERFPRPIVLMCGSLEGRAQELTFRALEAGGLSLVAKPAGLDDPRYAETVARLLDAVRIMAGVKVVRRWPRRPRPVPTVPSVDAAARQVRLVAIGASTGGPAALAEIFREVPAPLRVAVLVVQHIAAGFVAGLAAWLSTTTGHHARVAVHGEPLRPGTLYFAPEGVQMGIDGRDRIRLTRDAGANGFRPCASFLFASVAEVCGPRALGVVLTGMGRDGVEGLERMRAVGAITLAQDEATSVVFGMPGEALRSGAAAQAMSPSEIAGVLRTLSGPAEGSRT